MYDNHISFRRLGLRTVPINETWLITDYMRYEPTISSHSVSRSLDVPTLVEIRTNPRLRVRQSDPSACDQETGYVYEFTEIAVKLLRQGQRNGFRLRIIDNTNRQTIEQLHRADLIELFEVDPISGARSELKQYDVTEFADDFSYQVPPLSSPYRVYWDITDACNLRCKHCYVNSAKARQDGLTHEQAFQLIEELCSAEVFHVTFAGGEPMLHPKFFELVEASRKNGMVVSLLSNGTLMTNTNVELLRRTGVRGIQISLDGVNANTHDSFRSQPGTFSKTVSGIKNLRRYAPDIPVIVCCVVTKSNIQQVVDIMNLSLDIGARGFNVLELICIGRAKNEAANIPSPEEYRQLYEALLENYSKMNYDEFKLFFHSTVPGALLLNRGKPLSNNHVRFHCCAGRESCNINVRGEVSACSVLLDKEFIAGSVLTQSFLEIWRKSPVFDPWRFEPVLKGKCSSCEYKPHCLGSCRALAYGLTQDLFSEYPSCWK